MPSASRPTQQQVREYMQQRQRSDQPPPTPEEVRRQLGWGLIPHNEQNALMVAQSSGT